MMPQGDLHRFIGAGIEGRDHVLKAAPEPLRNLFKDLDEPPWLDWDALRPGIRAFHKNVDLMLVAFVDRRADGTCVYAPQLIQRDERDMHWLSRRRKTRTQQAVAFGLLLAACGGEAGPTNPGIVAPADTAAVAPPPPDTAAVPPDPRVLLADTLSVRAIYAIPTDRAYRSAYVRGIQRALVELQFWYLEQMHGTRTFRLYSSLPTVCELPHPDAHYWTRAFDKILADLQDCEPAVGAGDFI